MLRAASSMRSGAFVNRDPAYHAALFSISLVAFWASSFFGSVTVRTPLLKLASILSASTPSGTRKARSKEPKFRSRS
jgi:hypothetical protein